MARDAGNTNLEKACDLLLLLAKEGKPIAIAELAKLLNVSRPTVYAMLASFHSRGFVDRDEEGKYTIGYASMFLFDGFHQSFSFSGKAIPYLQDLARRWDQPVTLSVYRSPCYIANIWGTTMPHHDACPQSNMLNALLHAAGKLLMSYLPEEKIREDLEAAPPELLRGTVDKEQLASELMKNRGASYLIERSEHFPGRGSIAAAIYDRRGAILGCVSSTLQLYDFTEEREQRMTAEIVGTALRISEDLGYTAPL